jgi:hypothetical protein
MRKAFVITAAQALPLLRVEGFEVLVGGDGAGAELAAEAA